jgi:hypothetical protein
VIITSRQNDPSLFADKSQGNVHAEVDSLPNIAIESTIGRASRRDGASSDRPDADACRRRVSTKRYIRARARHSSGMECGPVPERARASASAGERCAIVPVFYRFVMH